MAIKKGYTYFLGACILWISTPAISYNTLFDIKGGIKMSTCEVLSSEVLYITLGDAVLGKNLFGEYVGSTSEKADWDVVLDCPKGVPISTYFTGTPVGTLRTVAELDKVSDAAKGFGVETEVSINGGDWSVVDIARKNNHLSSSEEGAYTMNFRSYYKQTSNDVSPGSANATMSLEIIYN